MVEKKTIMTKKEWAKRKVGMFAWVWRKQTVYNCSMSAGLVDQPSPTNSLSTEETLSVRGLGNTTNWDTFERLSGVGCAGPGANSEQD